MRSPQRWSGLLVGAILALLPLAGCGDSTYTAPQPVKGQTMGADSAAGNRLLRLSTARTELERRVTFDIAATRQKLREESDIVRRDLSQATAGADAALKTELRDIAAMLVALDAQQAAAQELLDRVRAQEKQLTDQRKQKASDESMVGLMADIDASLEWASDVLTAPIEPKADAKGVTAAAVEARLLELTRAPLPAVANADAKKRREQWRQEKLAKAAEKDTPGTVYTDPATGNPTLKPAIEPGKNDTKKGVTTAATDWVDPDNPNLRPADRSVAQNFDHTKATVIDGAIDVPFATLSGYPYAAMIGVKVDTKDDGSKGPNRVIPDSIKALHGKKIVIQGYMMPIDFEDGGTNEFILTRVIPSCFYCQPPQLNDWVEIKMEGGKRVPYVPDSPIQVFGEIKVGEVYEDGFIVCLYRMSGTKVEKAPMP